MALLKWNEDEELKEDESTPTPQVETIQSVQSNWNPTQANTAQPTDGGMQPAKQPETENYLMSEQKEQVDQQLAMRREAEAAAAAAEQARQIENARLTQAAQQAQQAQQQQQQPQSTPKYDSEPENEGVGGFLKNVGAGIQQGIGALGDIAIQGGSLIGSIGKDDQELVRHMAQAERVRGWLHGQTDVNGNNVIGTRDIDEAASRIASGKGSVRDFVSVGGKSLQAGIDATMFLNPARAAMSGARAIPTVNSATLASRVINSPAARYAARDAAFYGGLQGGATTASTYGETGDLSEALKAGTQDALIGGALQGSLDVAGSSINFAANRTMNSLRPGKDLPLVEGAGEVLEEGVTPAPNPVADGIVTPANEIQDGNLTFDTPNNPTNNPTAPIDEPAPVAPELQPELPPQVAPIDNIAPVVNEQQMPLDELEARAQQENPALTPVQAPVVADGTTIPTPTPAANPNMPMIKSEEMRQLQDARAGATQADEAQINQQLQQIENTTPRTADDELVELDERLDRGEISPDEHARLEDEIFARENAEGRIMAEDSELPDGMTETPATPEKPAKKTETYLQRTISSDASSKDVRSQLMKVSRASSGDIEFDEILDEIPKLPASTRAKIEENYSTVQSAEKRINQIQNQLRKDAGKDGGGTMSLDEVKELAHERNRLVQDMQIAEKNIASSIRRAESRQSLKSRALNAGANLTSYQQGNMLASLPVQEKNLVGDIIASASTAVQHPIKMATNIPEARLASEFKRAVREVAQVRPQSLSEVPKYIIRSALSPVYAVNNSMANVRGGMYRKELAKTELIKSGIKNPTAEQIKIQALRAGNAREIIVNLNKGVGSAMTDPYKAASAADEYFKVLDKAVSHKELAEFAQNTRESTDILQGMMSGKGRDGKVTPMSLLMNNLYPFINPAVNSFKKAIYQLDPTKASQMNEVRKIIQSPTRQNIAKLTKLAGTASAITAIVSLLNDETISYNDGDSDVSKPRGWSVKTGENTYMPVRAFGVFEPFIVGTGVVYEVMNGNVKNPKDGLKMAASSLPYLSSNEFYLQSVEEMGEGNMWGYGTQSQAVARTKNLVPFVNNGVERWSDRNAGKSTDSVSAYASKQNEKGETVPDFLPWLGNSIKAGFGNTEGLKKSYTPAGQLRTADNQGAFVNKTINDKNTKTHNSTISDLVDFARDNKLGEDSKDMFNTYDTGKNNNFKSVQDTITFLDGKPDNAKKLENNKKIGELAAQIRDGFWGDKGNELLTLDGKNIYSDVSVPNADGTKNSRLPLNMQSIKNAIAATDLPEKERNRMYEISQANTALYDKVTSKEWTYDQYKKAKAASEQEYVSILSNSESYKKLGNLMNKLDGSGFFKEGGIGSTKSGQTYLWNSLNALLGSKGATPAANYPKASKGFGSGGGGRRGSGFKATNKSTDRGSQGVKWTPVKAREMAVTKKGKYTPVSIKVKLGNAVKKDKTQNYADRTF